MKNTVRIVLGCVMVFCLLFGLSKVFWDSASAREMPPEAIDAAVFETETESRTESGFVVKSVSGRIAVEDISTGKIVRTTDTRVASLPEKDRAQLESGIIVRSKSELRSVLEDLCS